METEPARRENDGIAVTLVWHSGTDRLTVKVRDERRRMIRRAAAALGCIVLSCVAARSAIAATDDVARFYRALLRGRLVRGDMLSEMEQTVPMGFASNAYGLGLW